MAGRGAKAKDYKIPVISVKHWLKEIDFDGLLGKYIFRFEELVHS